VLLARQSARQRCLRSSSRGQQAGVHPKTRALRRSPRLHQWSSSTEFTARL
jgi:hypothetical protein